MKNIDIVETTVGLHLHLVERKQGQMLCDIIELGLRTRAQLGTFRDDPNNHILQDLANELEEYIQAGYPVFMDDKQ